MKTVPGFISAFWSRAASLPATFRRESTDQVPTGEELYKAVEDPHEWDNLASQEKFRTVRYELRQSAPKHFAPPGPETKDLRLVTEGEHFHWEPKTAGNTKKSKANK